jgi:aminoglycoside phosphotransferase (APT) family kinase protein
MLDIEHAGDLLAYLRSAGHIGPHESPRIENLAGGVSNRTVLVRRPGGPAWVLKQALPKLRVAMEWYSSPERVHREAAALRWLTRLAPPGATVALVFEDRQHHVIAMQAVPEPHENWKSLLLQGRVQAEHATTFGILLGTIHHRGREAGSALAAEFDDRSFFESLRIEPYYLTAATRTPQATLFLEKLVAETRTTRLSFVHGDYSPKNILVHAGQLVLLDHEVAHFGDPAFDLGFALAHLLSKGHHLPSARQGFLHAARIFWEAYCTAAGDLTTTAGCAARVVRHSLGCLLARVDGRSPLEYLTPAERDRQRLAVLRLMENPPSHPTELFQAFGDTLAVFP